MLLAGRLYTTEQAIAAIVIGALVIGGIYLAGRIFGRGFKDSGED